MAPGRAPAGTDTFRELSGQLLDDGYAVRFRASGTSMEPAIGDGDWITVARVSPGEIVRGDVIFYHSGRRTIAHRVVEIRATQPDGPMFVVRGDAKAGCDAPVMPGQILGKVVAVEPAGSRRPFPAWRRLLRKLLLVIRARRGRP